MSQPQTFDTHSAISFTCEGRGPLRAPFYNYNYPRLDRGTTRGYFGTSFLVPSGLDSPRHCVIIATSSCSMTWQWIMYRPPSFSAVVWAPVGLAVPCRVGVDDGVGLRLAGNTTSEHSPELSGSGGCPEPAELHGVASGSNAIWVKSVGLSRTTKVVFGATGQTSLKRSKAGHALPLRLTQT